MLILSLIPFIFVPLKERSKMKNIHSQNFKIGILGGGQLGRMTLQEGYNLNLHIDILDPSPNSAM